MSRDYSIGYSSFPFTPDPNQLIYVENQYDDIANRFITNNYEEICSMFAAVGKEFYYFPKLVTNAVLSRKLLYYAPYLPADILRQTKSTSSSILRYMVRPENKKIIQPSIQFYDGPKYQDSSFNMFAL